MTTRLTLVVFFCCIRMKPYEGVISNICFGRFYFIEKQR